jgi:site-specific DNA-cytosine methylase
MYLLTDHIMAEKKLIQTNPRHSKPVDMDEPSRTVKVDGRGGDFCFDTMLLPLNVPATTILGDPRMSTHEHHYRRNQYYFRRLTVRECMRLQSFPDWWVFPKDVSTSKRYKLVGEAVPPMLAYRIAVDLGKALGMSVKEPPQAEDWDLPYFRRAFADYLNGV